MLILADVGNVAEARDRLNTWIDNGGVLVRFAGPHLAGAADDDLVPVKLRRGGRILGGSLSWDKPQQLAAFSRDGPFAGMTVPNDVTVNRQVLAEPDAELSDRTWATLADGTPLVTAQRRGKGLLVLFHVTADTRWSDLPLSGTFVEMLKRIVALANSTASGDSEGAGTRPTRRRKAAQPRCRRRRVLDGFGAFTVPPATARPVPANFTGRANADHPPGFYGPPEGLVAVNTLAPSDRPRRSTFRHSTPASTSTGTASRSICAARYSLPRWRCWCSTRWWCCRSPAASSHAAAPARRRRHSASARRLPPRRWRRHRRRRKMRPRRQPAPPRDDFAMKATLQTHLAYIITGDAEVDAISKAGLQGLTLFLAQRTALEAGRADRARSGARRARLLSVDLLAGGARRGEALAGSARPHRRLHEARRHGAVRHARRGRRNARR